MPERAPTPLSAQTFPANLYAHIPFCASLCRYCDFASEVHTAARAERYLSALEKELRVRVAALARDERFAPRTIYVGGGTPTAMSIAELTRFFDLLQKHVDGGRVAEFTIEANPGTTDAAKLELLRRRGVNRISFGVQSLQPRFLTLLGRSHSAEQAREAVPMARAAGFDNVSVDLIHGLPGQSPDDLRWDIEAVAALQTEHVSAYGLTYEEGTPLHAAVQRGEIAPLTPEQEAAHYLAVMEALEQAGLLQYEISNYARSRRESQHNLIYWRNEAYLGVGASAASFIHWRRSTNYDDVDAYVQAVEATGDATAMSEELTPEARAREALILELRLRRGVAAEEFKDRWGLDVAVAYPALQDFLREGLMERTAGGRYRITRRGLPVADGILAEFV